MSKNTIALSRASAITAGARPMLHRGGIGQGVNKNWLPGFKFLMFQKNAGIWQSGI